MFKGFLQQPADQATVTGTKTTDVLTSKGDIIVYLRVELLQRPQQRRAQLEGQLHHLEKTATDVLGSKGDIIVYLLRELLGAATFVFPLYCFTV
jgi:hypothetical protein